MITQPRPKGLQGLLEVAWKLQFFNHPRPIPAPRAKIFPLPAQKYFRFRQGQIWVESTWLKTWKRCVSLVLSRQEVLLEMVSYLFRPFMPS